MLFLIGIGLADPEDISLKGLNAVKKCEKIYLESYTSKLACSKEKLEELYGKSVTLANREFVEGAEQLLEEAKNGNVALLIIGDALCATTHWDILERAKDLGIETEVIHNASVMNAISATGLQLYKFGKTTSMPFPQEHKIETFYNILKQNKSISAHTLILLDLDPENNKYLTIPRAIDNLREVEKRRKEELFLPDTKCIGVARLGFKDQKIFSGTAKEVCEEPFGEAPHALIVPGDLHFMEEDALKKWE